MNNLIALTDSYKFSHWNTYPEGTEQVYSYMESRGGEYKDVVFFGLQYYLNKFLRDSILVDNIEAIEQLAGMHGVPYNSDGWKAGMEIYKPNKNGFYPVPLKLEGKPFDFSGRCQPWALPIEIHAVPEGSINRPGDVLLTITNTDPRFPWLVGWLETLLMKVWYPTTIASKSFAVKQMLKKHYENTSDNPSGADFAYHNFGDRGSSSVESAAVGGMAHLTQFKGTDNFNSLLYAKEYYSEECAGYSIPATEHSTVTSWGRENEYAFYENYLETYKSYPLIACVLDSYNIYEAVKFVTSGSMKAKIESDEYPIFVIRPDSGEPIEIISSILSIMYLNKIAFTLNSKGYKVFNKYRIIWGDGITPDVINDILEKTTAQGYAADNFAFGSGGDLMQNVNRDTCKFAIKCSAVKVNGEWRDVYKDPISDPGKASKRGLVTNPNLQLVYRNGELFNTSTFAEIRERSNA